MARNESVGAIGAFLRSKLAGMGKLGKLVQGSLQVSVESHGSSTQSFDGAHGIHGAQGATGASGAPYVSVRPALPLTLFPVAAAWAGMLAAEALCWRGLVDKLPIPTWFLVTVLVIAGLGSLLLGISGFRGSRAFHRIRFGGQRAGLLSGQRASLAQHGTHQTSNYQRAQQVQPAQPAQQVQSAQPAQPAQSTQPAPLAQRIWQFLRPSKRMSLIIGLTAASLLLALASGLHYWGQLKESGQQLESLQVIEFGARLIGDPSQGAYSSQSTARISAKNIQTVSVRLFWPAGEEPAALGSRIKAKAKLRPLQEHQEFLFQKGIAASYVLETVDQRGFPADPYGVLGKFRETNTKALSDLGTDGGLLLRGVLLGDSNELYASDTGLAFRMTGLMHLVAVSGSHLAVIAAMLTWLLKRLGLRRLPQLAILAGILVAYVMLTAFQPSAIRATIMVVVVQAAGLSNRRAHAPSALGLAALLMILIHPPTAFSLGFWLSVFAVASLTLFLPLIRGWLSGSIDTVGEFARSLLNRQWGAIGFWQGTAGYRQGKSWHQQLAIGNQQDTGGHRQAASVLQQGVATPQTSRQKNSSSRAAAVGRSLLDPLAMTLCAQLGTAPLTLPIFAACPLVSPLANLLAAPLVTLQLLVGLPTLIIGSVFPSIRGLIVRFLGAIADLTCRLTEILADLPLACLPFSSALIPSLIWSLAIAALLYMLWPQFSRRTLPIPALAIALLIGFGLIQPLLPAKPELVVMDVGQGDAILIRDGRKSILLDTGPNETALLKALGRNQVVDLDAVMLSHLDADHSAALPILRTVQPEQVLLPAGLFEHQSTDAVIQKAATLCQGRQPRGLLSGDRLILGPRLTLTVLLPDTEVSESSNENCLVCALEYDADADGRSEARILLTGDAESSALQQLSEAEVEGGFQVIKVGHHGSKGAISGEQLKSWGCQAALISVGENNQFGHPTPETLEALTTNGVQVLRTDLDGDIHLNFKQGKIELSCATIEQFNE